MPSKEALRMMQIMQILDIEQLEPKIGLHQSVKIIYVVDGFVAYYNHTDDDELPQCHAHGKTIIEALANLSKVATKPARRK